MRRLNFDKSEWERLRGLCAEGYPKEVCGLLFGKAENGSVRVIRVQKLENILDERHRDRLKELVAEKAVSLPEERMGRGGAFEFLVDPQEHCEKVAKAERDGLDQIGVFHSHPDHPAQPSPTDAAQPLLAGWSNVIVAVDQGKFKEARSWYRADENLPFQEENIIIS